MTPAQAPPSEEWALSDPARRPERSRSLTGGSIAGLVGLTLLIVGLAMAAAIVVSQRAEKVYGGRADVVFVALGDQSSDVRDRTLNTQKELILSRAVLLPVAREVRRPLAELEDAVDVSLAPDDLVRITVSDADPPTARSLVTRVTRTYMGLSGDLSAEQREAEALIRSQIGVVRGRLRQAPQDQRYIFTDRVNRLEDQLLQLRVERLSQPEPAPRLLAAPYVLDEPLSPKPVRAAALGLVVGLLLATAVVVVLLRRRWRQAS